MYPVVSRLFVLSLGLLLLAACEAEVVPEAPYDLVIANGRVIDPESETDSVLHIGIRGGRIASLSARPLQAPSTLDATGLVVAPGFVDLHVHGHDDANYRLKVLDGVTTALELEVGTADVAAWYAARDGGTLINHGVSIGHVPTRMQLLGDSGTFLPTGPAAADAATPEQIEEITRRIQAGLEAGALGVGMGIQYTPAATRWEVLEVFRTAATQRAPVFVHVRSFGEGEPGSSVEAFMEVIGAAAVTGVPLHIVHLNSMSLASTPRTLRLVEEAKARGMDITTEAYPYSAGMTRIESALLDPFENAADSVLGRLQWVQTGERLTRATFRRYRREGGSVILHLNTPDMEAAAITSPLTAIASDGLIENGRGHPRQAGTYARVLGHYVRATGQLTLAEAIRKMTLIPARRLERWAPEFRDRGRIRADAVADLVVFDPATVRDRSTYEDPTLPSEGFRHVLVNGVAVVRDGQIVEGARPGRGLRGGTRRDR